MSAEDPRWPRIQEFSRTTSNNPRQFAYVVTSIVDDDIWREFQRPPHRTERYDSFDKFCQDYGDLSSKKVLEVCEVVGIDTEDRNPHQPGLEKLRRLVLEEIPEANDVDENRMSNTHPQDRHDAGAVIARLKRDDPALAAEVIAGTISPHAAALRAGIRRPRFTVVADDVAQAVAALLRHYRAGDVMTALVDAEQGAAEPVALREIGR